MKIVIDIPDNFNLENEVNTVDNPVIRKALKNGKPLDTVLDDIRAEFKKKANSNDWYHTTDGLVWGEAMEIIDKHRQAESEEV